MEGEFHYAKQTRYNSWLTNYNSLTDVEELFLFFCMLRIEGELHYTREINILLLLHSQSGRGVSLENLCPPRYSSSSTFSEWKGSSFTISEWKESFIRKSLPTLILASAFTEKEKIFFFFYILRVEGEFHYAKQTRSTSWITNYNSLADVEEELFFFFCMFRMEGEFHYTREININQLNHEL